MFIAISSSCEQ